MSEPAITPAVIVARGPSMSHASASC